MQGGEVLSSCNKRIGNYVQNECLELFHDIAIIENVWKMEMCVIVLVPIYERNSDKYNGFYNNIQYNIITYLYVNVYKINNLFNYLICYTQIFCLVGTILLFLIFTIVIKIVFAVHNTILIKLKMMFFTFISILKNDLS